MMSKQVYFLVSSLAEFCRKIPPPSTLYLNLDWRTNSRLDLYGVKNLQIIWLHTNVDTEFERLLPAPITRDQLRHQFPLFRRKVSFRLTDLGYDVRAGCYIIYPQKPIPGSFECVRFKIAAADYGHEITLEEVSR